jgi:hypothetical protein
VSSWALAIVGLLVLVDVCRRTRRWWKERRVVAGFHRLQQMLSSPGHYRKVTSADRHLVERIPENLSEQVAQHAALLGDTILHLADRVAAIRLFVDAERTTVLYIYAGETRTTVAANSFTNELEFKTSFGGRQLWAVAPFLLSQRLKSTVSIPKLLAAHRAFVTGATREPLLRIETIDDAIRIWVDMRHREIAWRAEQEPDELLERDLRLLLGRAYVRLGSRLSRKVRARIPKARVRTPRGR